MAVDIPTLQLSDLQQGRAIVDKDGKPTEEFLRIVNGNTRNQRRFLTALAQAVTEIQTVLGIAEGAAATATATNRELARINSYPLPTNMLSAADAGTSATITIANHLRVYPVQGTYDVPDLSVTGGTITGQPYSTLIYVYYDDTSLADSTPSYQATTDGAFAQAGAAAGRHFVGAVTTPAPGGGGTTGGGGSPPGGGGPYQPYEVEQ